MFFSSWLRRRSSKRTAERRSTHKPTAPQFRPHLEALEGRIVPSTLTVTNNLDSGAGSLRAVIARANSKDTIVFAPALTGQTITLTSGELDISRSLTIRGPGAGNLSISGGDASRVFEVDGSKSAVTLSGLTITHGKSYAGGGGDFNSASGGGILNYQANLTVSDCTISYSSGSQGGGIRNDGGTVTLTACTLSHNHSDNGGGFFNNGTASLSGCTLIANTATSDGGGLYNFSGTNILSVNGCTFTSDPPFVGPAQSAEYGGGIYVNAGTVTVSNCTFASNIASQGGGAAIYNLYGRLTISGSTFSDPYNYDRDYIDGMFYSGNGGFYTDGGGNTFH